jgi:hypothetical protein
MLSVDRPHDIDPVRLVLDDALVEDSHAFDADRRWLGPAIVDVVTVLFADGNLRESAAGGR